MMIASSCICVGIVGGWGIEDGADRAVRNGREDGLARVAFRFGI